MATGMTPNHNLSIPPLMPGERIANWKPLFLAAVAPLIEQKAEIKLFRFCQHLFVVAQRREN